MFSNNSRCLTQTLYAVQNATGESITVSFLESLISGNSTELSALSALDSNVLCTECVKGMYQQALAANSTIGNSPVASAISSKCGSSFACESEPFAMQIDCFSVLIGPLFFSLLGHRCLQPSHFNRRRVVHLFQQHFGGASRVLVECLDCGRFDSRRRWSDRRCYEHRRISVSIESPPLPPSS